MKRVAACSLVALPIAMSLESGCARTGYTVIKESEHGGIVALEGDQTEARPQAEGYMHGRCGTPGYSIVHEGEENGAGTFRGRQGGWRIEYTCNPKDALAESDERQAREAAARDAGPHDAGSTWAHSRDSGARAGQWDKK